MNLKSYLYRQTAVLSLQLQIEILSTLLLKRLKLQSHNTGCVVNRLLASRLRNRGSIFGVDNSSNYHLFTYGVITLFATVMQYYTWHAVVMCHLARALILYRRKSSGMSKRSRMIVYCHPRFTLSAYNRLFRAFTTNKHHKTALRTSL